MAIAVQNPVGPAGTPNKAAAETRRHFLAALAAYREQHYAEAQRELASLLSSNPGNFDINELAGLVYGAQGEDEKANHYLAKAVRLKPSVAEARTVLGTNLLRLHRPLEAETQFRKVVDLKPRDYDANHNLGEFYIQTGKIAAAIPFLKRAQEVEPTAYNNGYDLALAYEQSGSLGEARQALQRLIALRDSAELHSLLGEVEERSGNYLASAAQYQQAAHMEPSEQNILDWGSELLLHDTFEPAAEVFKAGLARFTQSARLQDGLGIALYGLGKFDDAARSFFRASDLDRSDPLPLIFAGKAYDNLSPPVAIEARSRFQNFLETDMHNAPVRYYYAMCLWKINEREPQPQLNAQIESLLEQAVALDPSYGEAYLQLGVLYAGQHKYQNAIGEYQQALKFSPNLSGVHYRLGQALARTGDSTRAKQEFAEFERLRQQEVEDANKQHNQIQQFVYTMRNSGQNNK